MQRAAEAKAEEQETSLGELLGAAKDTSWVVRDLDGLKRLVAKKNEDSPVVTEAHWENLTDRNKYDNDQLDAFRELIDEGGTEGEWEGLLEEFAVTHEAQRVVAENGWTGLAAQTGMTLLDPTFLGVTAGSVASGNAITAGIIGSRKLSTLGRLTKTFVEAGAADSAIMALRTQTTSDYGAEDMMIDTLSTLAAVGVMEAAVGAKAAHAAHKMEQGLAGKYIDNFEKRGDLSVGAKQAERVLDTDFARFDDFGRMAQSENTYAQEFATNVLQDAVGGGSHSAAVLAQRTRDHYIGRQNAAFYGLWKEHKKTFKGGVVKQAQEINRLSEQVWESVVMDIDHGPEIGKVAKVIRESNAELLSQAKASNLNGFKDVDSLNTYMKQEWDHHSWRSIQAGTDGLTEHELVELIHRGLEVEDVPLAQQLSEAKLKAARSPKKGKGRESRKSKAAKEKIAELEAHIEARKRLATGFVKRMIDAADGTSTKLDELLADEESLVKWIREDPSHAKSSEDDIRDFVRKALTDRSRQKNNVIDRARKRIHINPKAEFKKGGRTHRVADLMSRDAFGLQQAYVHEMTGHIAMAERLNIKGPSDWNQFLKDAAAKEIELNSSHPNAQKKADELVQKMEELKREVYGHNRYDLSSDGARAMSVMMKYNFVTTMGKAAFAAFSEFGRILGENRARNLLKVLPSLHRLITDSFRTVNKHDSIVKEANSLNASIGDEYLHRYFNDFDELGTREGRFTEGLLNKSELYAHRASRLMSKASFLAPMDKALRMLSFQTSMNSLYAHLMKGQNARLAFEEMGMSKELLERIRANMKQHSVETDFWDNVTKLNIEKWDRKTADDMMDALTVNGARQVQKTIAGENTKITSHRWGRVLLQFRKFAIDSYAKHLRADIRSARNGQALRVMLSNMHAMIFAAAGYAARTQTATVGMDDHDRREYLEERLAPERLAANMAAYTPAAGPVVSAWNTVPGWMFPDAEIPVSRASGLDNSNITANPSVDKVNRLGNLFHDIPGSDSENTMRRLRPFIPAQNSIWGDLLLNSTATALK